MIYLQDFKDARYHEHKIQAKNEVIQGQPNTTLFCLILALGTFFIAYYLRQFWNSKFLGRSLSTSLCIRFYNRNVCICGCFCVLLVQFCLLSYYVTDILFPFIINHHHHHLLYSINPSLCTDTIGCGTCHGGIYNIVKYNHYT